MTDTSIFIKILEQGKLFFPAIAHYRKDNGNVECDRCHVDRLSCAIGADVGDKSYDLCMSCIQIVADIRAKQLAEEKQKAVEEENKKAKSEEIGEEMREVLKEADLSEVRFLTPNDCDNSSVTRMSQFMNSISSLDELRMDG
jgi:hypothetical protein